MIHVAGSGTSPTATLSSSKEGRVLVKATLSKAPAKLTYSLLEPLRALMTLLPVKVPTVAPARLKVTVLKASIDPQ